MYSSGFPTKKGASKFGDSTGYKSTVKMNFRGQDVENKNQFSNPNDPVSDEYIENLQQQLHFMDLEFKILKEKVMEDEKKSGIGSLYDDDKTSHQHINLLKTKYASMLKQHHKTMTLLQKKQLEVQGETFVLQAHLNISKKQNEDLKRTFDEYLRDTNSNLKDLKKKHEITNRERSDLDLEVQNTLRNDLERTRKTRFDHKMTIDKDAKFEEVLKARHDQEMKLMSEIEKRKLEEQQQLVKAQQDHETAYKNHKELQDCIAETQKLRDDIEVIKVQILAKHIEVQILTEATETLNAKKEELLHEKQEAEIKNEELKQQLKAQQEVAHKRLMSKLQRDKTQEIKDLLVQQESLKEFGDTLGHKLHEEKDKFDKLLDQKLTRDEELRLLTLQFNDDTAAVDLQKKELDELNKLIEAEQAKVNDIQGKVEQQRKTKYEEEEKHRQLQNTNTARMAKKTWIESTYNYSDNVEQMKTEIFKQIVETNTDVNEHVNTFTSKLATVQKELMVIKSKTFMS